MSRPDRATVGSAPAGRVWRKHWSAVLGTADPDPCYLCRRRQRAAECGQMERIAEARRERALPEPQHKATARLVVCKGCCIRALDGHRCVWWDFCWR